MKQKMKTKVLSARANPTQPWDLFTLKDIFIVRE
jgi:hypothetical protein